MKLPKRTAAELAQALTERANLLSGQSWEVPATKAMMLEAAELLGSLKALREYVQHKPDCASGSRSDSWGFGGRSCSCGLDDVLQGTAEEPHEGPRG